MFWCAKLASVQQQYLLSEYSKHLRETILNLIRKDLKRISPQIISQITNENDENEKKKADMKKFAYTIAVIGKSTYYKLKDLCLPNKPTEKNFDEICGLLKGYYKPSVLIVAEAYKFHQARQEVGESVSMYANRLCRLSVNCQLDSFLNLALRDQFVCGIRNRNSLKKLLSQDKTFQECLIIAIVDEAADKESKGLTNTESVIKQTEMFQMWIRRSFR